MFAWSCPDSSIRPYRKQMFTIWQNRYVESPGFTGFQESEFRGVFGMGALMIKTFSTPSVTLRLPARIEADYSKLTMDIDVTIFGSSTDAYDVKLFDYVSLKARCV